MIITVNFPIKQFERKSLKKIRASMGFKPQRLKPIEALIFFRLLSNCLNWKIYCDDHFSLSSTTVVEI